MKASQVILFALAALPAMLLVGCRQPAPVSEVEVERLPDAEAVLAQLGQKAYVFKHQGGEVTAQFTLYHTPAGTNQKERVIFQADGDEALRLHHGGTGAPGKDGDPAGYLIVTVPGRSTATTEGELTFRFNLGEATCGKSAKVATVYAGTALSPYPLPRRPGEPRDKPAGPRDTDGVVLDLPMMQYGDKWFLSPGETITPLDHEWWYGTPADELRLKQANDQPQVIARQLDLEKFRAVLEITALKNGQLPKRGPGK